MEDKNYGNKMPISTKYELNTNIKILIRFDKIDI